MPDATSILVVDGNASMGMMLRRFLERHNLQVQVAMSVAEARDMVDRHPFHLILTDLFLPRQDGIALLHHVRRVTPQTRVVIMAAFRSSEVAQHILAAGAHACLKKPFSLRHLWNVVQQAMHESDPMMYHQE